MDKLCVHASMGPTRPTQSTGAMVAHLKADLSTYWLTGTSGTCTGIFKPAYLTAGGLPDTGPRPSGHYDPDSMWWAHERLHRAVIRDYATRLPVYQAERDALEAGFRRTTEEIAGRVQHLETDEQVQALAATAATCFNRAAEATAQWTELVTAVPVKRSPPRLFSLAWDILNRQAAFAGNEPR